MTLFRRLWGWVVLGTLTGCKATHGSSVRTGAALSPYEGTVSIVSLAAPEGATEVGIVQVRGIEPIDKMQDELRSQAASIGADLVKIDEISTKFELVTRTESYSYNCGTGNAIRTCTGTRTVTSEVGTTQILARGFRTH